MYIFLPLTTAKYSVMTYLLADYSGIPFLAMGDFNDVGNPDVDHYAVEMQSSTPFLCQTQKLGLCDL